MIDTHPDAPVIDGAALSECIEALAECAQACAACADACLAEPDAHAMASCIRLALDCADLCQTAARIASRQQPAEVAVLARLLELCALAADLCGDHLEQRAGAHAHCAVCVESCRRCEAACQRALHKLPGAATRPVIPAMAH